MAPAGLKALLSHKITVTAAVSWSRLGGPTKTNHAVK